MPAVDSYIVLYCNWNLTVICVWIAGCQRFMLKVKKMSGQVRWKGRFKKNKTLDYEVRRNSGLVEARKRKYSAGNYTYASKLVVCVCVCVCVSRPTADKLKKGNSVAGSQYCYVYLFESDWNLNVLNYIIYKSAWWRDLMFFQKCIFLSSTNTDIFWISLPERLITTN